MEKIYRGKSKGTLKAKTCAHTRQNSLKHVKSPVQVSPHPSQSQITSPRIDSMGWETSIFDMKNPCNSKTIKTSRIASKKRTV